MASTICSTADECICEHIAVYSHSQEHVKEIRK